MVLEPGICVVRSKASSHYANADDLFFANQLPESKAMPTPESNWIMIRGCNFCQFDLVQQFRRQTAGAGGRGSA